MLVRYSLATVACCLLIGGALAFAGHARSAFLNELRKSLKEQKVAGELPPELEDADLDTITLQGLHGFEIEVSDLPVTKLLIADAIQCWWLVWLPLVVVMCFGTAYLAESAL